jgi:predicted transcriptional regulator of viral defense system
MILIMESWTLSKIQKALSESNLQVIRISDLQNLLGLKNRNTTYKLTQRLIKKEILTSLIGGKYLVKTNPPAEFIIANILCEPSYISLESALSYYGILPQFPFAITSITSRKSRKYEVKTINKTFIYSRISSRWFWGYEKKDGFLIATPEKALLDILYFDSKGISNLDPKELDITQLRREEIMKLLESFETVAKYPKLKIILNMLND